MDHELHLSLDVEDGDRSMQYLVDHSEVWRLKWVAPPWTTSSLVICDPTISTRSRFDQRLVEIQLGYPQQYVVTNPRRAPTSHRRTHSHLEIVQPHTWSQRIRFSSPGDCKSKRDLSIVGVARSDTKLSWPQCESPSNNVPGCGWCWVDGRANRNTDLH